MSNLAVKREPELTLFNYLVQAGVRDDLPWARDIVMGLKPKKWQITGLNQALTQPNNRFGLYDEVGTMKTLQIQAFSLYHASMGNKSIVCMPPILLEQYQSSLDSTFIGWRDKFSLHILTEGPAARDKLFARFDKEGWPDLLLLSYQMFSKLPRPTRTKVEGEWVQGKPREQDFLSKVFSGKDIQCWCVTRLKP